MRNCQQLSEAFGGRWDGEKPEIHGLVERGGDKLKIELLFSRARKIWSCSVFNEGACVGQASSGDVVTAVRLALQNE